MDLSARTAGQSNDREPDGSLHRDARRPGLIRVGWVAIVTLLLALALWIGLTTSRPGGAAIVRPAASATVVAAASSSANAAAQATPTDQQRAAWYLQQEDTEQDYCQCGR